MSVRTASIPVPATGISCRLPGRVYRRRRFTAMVVVLVVVAGSILLARAASVALAGRAGGPASAAAARTGDGAFVPAALTYVAQPGDTLWAIAQRFHGDTALDWYVDELVEVNGTASIQAGQRIVLP